MYGCLSSTPNWGPSLQPRHVPWLEIEPTTLWFTVWHSIHWATPARAISPILQMRTLRLREAKNFAQDYIRSFIVGTSNLCFFINNKLLLLRNKTARSWSWPCFWLIASALASHFSVGAFFFFFMWSDLCLIPCSTEVLSIMVAYSLVATGMEHVFLA